MLSENLINVKKFQRKLADLQKENISNLKKNDKMIKIIPKQNRSNSSILDLNCAKNVQKVPNISKLSKQPYNEVSKNLESPEKLIVTAIEDKPYFNSDENSQMIIKKDLFNKIGINNKLEEINNLIFTLDRNISSLNCTYKNILIKININLSQEETVKYKKAAWEIANSLKEKTEKLCELKYDQQELIKYSLF